MQEMLETQNVLHNKKLPSLFLGENRQANNGVFADPRERVGGGEK
jgi:hypothetical protein